VTSWTISTWLITPSSNCAGGDRLKNRSCPDPAADSAAMRAGSSVLRMWSTLTCTSFAWPQFTAHVLSNQTSQAGTKCAHWKIAADEVGVDAGRERPVIGAGDEGERVHKLVQHQREREDDHRQDPRNRDRENNSHQRLQPRGAVDPSCILELLRDRLEESHQQ